MEKIKDAIDNLSNHIGKDKIKQISLNRYFVDSGLMSLFSLNSLPINLVEFDGKLFFADYGKMFEYAEIDYPLLDSEQKNVLDDIFQDYDIIFDGKTIMCETDENDVYADYNIFVRTLIFVEDLFLSKN